MSLNIPILLLIGLYFAPGMVASMRHQRNAQAIWVLDLLLGWSVLGWAVAMVWASMDQPASPAPPAPPRPKRTAFERVLKGTL